MRNNTKHPQHAMPRYGSWHISYIKNASHLWVVKLYTVINQYAINIFLP